jgi:hypothetical protein
LLRIHKPILAPPYSYGKKWQRWKSPVRRDPRLSEGPICAENSELTAFTLMAQEKTGHKPGYEIGRWYARIFIAHDDDESRRSVFCFIDLTDGNVLRADGWKRANLTIKNPVRGNVFDEDKGSGSITNAGTRRKWHPLQFPARLMWREVMWWQTVRRWPARPLAIRSDNGVPFASPNALFNISKLSIWWLRLGIAIERIKPGHPQQNGRHERMTSPSRKK